MTQVQQDLDRELPAIASIGLFDHRAVKRDVGKILCACGNWYLAANHPTHRRQALSLLGIAVLPSSILKNTSRTLRAFLTQRISDMSEDEVDPGVNLHADLGQLDAVSARFALAKDNHNHDWIRGDTSDTAIMELVTATVTRHQVDELFSWDGTYDITCDCGSVMPEDFHAGHRLWELLDQGLIVADVRPLMDIAKWMLSTSWDWDRYYLDGFEGHEKYREPIQSAMSVASEMMDYLTQTTVR